MQGIYRDYPLTAGDVAWTCALSLTQDDVTGVSQMVDVYRIIERSGSAGIVKP